MDIPIYNKQKCKDAYDGDIKDGMTCAGLEDGGQDACQVIFKTKCTYKLFFFKYLF